ESLEAAQLMDAGLGLGEAVAFFLGEVVAEHVAQDTADRREPLSGPGHRLVGCLLGGEEDIFDSPSIEDTNAPLVASSEVVGTFDTSGEFLLWHEQDSSAMGALATRT